MAVGQNLDGRLETFCPNAGYVICHIWQISPDGGGNGENELGGSAYVQVAVGQNEDGRLEIFYVGFESGVVYHNWQTSPNGSWNGEAALGGENSPGGWGQIAVGQNADGR